LIEVEKKSEGMFKKKEISKLEKRQGNIHLRVREKDKEDGRSQKKGRANRKRTNLIHPGLSNLKLNEMAAGGGGFSIWGRGKVYL